MFDCVGVDFKIVLGSGVLVEGRIMGFPIYIGMVGREGEWSCVEWVDMGPHSVLSLFGHDPFDLDLLLVLLLFFDVLLFIVALGMVSLHLID